MPDALDMTVVEEEGYAVVRTDGYINNLGGERVSEECSRLIEVGKKHLILNLEKSTVVNSVGISILIEIIEALEDVDGSLAFCGLTPTIAKTFRIMRLTDATTIFDSETDAIKALSE